MRIHVSLDLNLLILESDDYSAALSRQIDTVVETKGCNNSVTSVSALLATSVKRQLTTAVAITNFVLQAVLTDSLV
jgi:hypothetical protein